MPSRTGSQSGEARGGERERDDVSSPLISRFPVPDFRTRRNERWTRGGAAQRGRGRSQMEKKEPGFTSRSRANERSWSTRSSTNCLRGTGLGINLLLALRLPFRSFPAYRLLYSKLYQTSRDVPMRSLCGGKKTWANLHSW